MIGPKSRHDDPYGFIEYIRSMGNTVKFNGWLVPSDGGTSMAIYDVGNISSEDAVFITITYGITVLTPDFLKKHAKNVVTV